MSWRFRAHAFESMMGLNSIVMGLVGLWPSRVPLDLRWVQPPELAAALDAAYALAGGMVVLGLLTRRRLELPGLFLLGASALVRIFVGVYAIGVTANMTAYAATISYHLFLLLAAGGRMHSMIRGDLVVTTPPGAAVK